MDSRDELHKIFIEIGEDNGNGKGEMDSPQVAVEAKRSSETVARYLLLTCVENQNDGRLNEQTNN